MKLWLVGARVCVETVLLVPVGVLFTVKLAVYRYGVLCVSAVSAMFVSAAR